jgi:hypothetical protein
VRIGTRQVSTVGIPRLIFQDLYHYFMTVTWPQLFGTFAAFFLCFDLLFGFLYHLNPGCIANLNPPGFAGAFFFSVETLARHNVVQDASAQLRMLRDEITTENFRIRRVVDLPLLRSQHPMFVLGWTLMHVIDESSPLKSETAESLKNSGASFVLSMSGTDETTGQQLMSRAEYSHADIRWNAAFRDILEELEDGSLRLDYRRFHDIEPLAAHPQHLDAEE